MRTGNLNSDGFCKQPISNAAFCGTWWVGLNEKQMLIWGFHCFDREGWTKNSLRRGWGKKGRNGLATPCIHSCNKVSGFMLTYWRFAPQLQPAVQAWTSYVLIEVIQ